ncbi:MAG: DinB family protein [Actinomycetaceae bacterium]
MTTELEDNRPEPPDAAGEWETLNGFLDFQRATFAWKCAGLSAEQLRQPLPPSAMTLVGMMKHLALVEDDWFGYCLGNEPEREPWSGVDWKATPDWEWETALTDDPADVRTLWETSASRAREASRRVYETEGLGSLMKRPYPDGRAMSLRWILTHMVEEYSRHNGHADLLRESIDGRVGE